VYVSRSRETPSTLLTRLGWQFLFIGLFAMIGGVIRSYNLPLALAGLILSALLIHWRWSRHTVASIGLRRELPEEAYVGQPLTIRFRVTNRSRWLPAWLVRIDDSICGPELAKPAQERWVPRGFGRRGQLPASCGVGVVPQGGIMTAEYRCSVARRGRYDFGPVRVSSGSPLGLLTSRRAIEAAGTLFVFPQLLRLRADWRQQIWSHSSGDSVNARSGGGMDGEFFGIRGWRAGDSRRWIHWRTTARIGEPAVRQFEQDRRLRCCVVVDGHLLSADVSGDVGRRPAAGELTAEEAALERVLSVAATIITRMSGSSNSRIGLVLVGREIVTLSNLGGLEHTKAMLRCLAGLVGHPRPDLADAMRQTHRLLGQPRSWLVLSPRLPDDGHRQLFGSQPLADCRWLSTHDGSLDQLLESPNSGTDFGLPESQPADVAALGLGGELVAGREA
jgi:uncharacterized protein (DUF58 family)